MKNNTKNSFLKNDFFNCFARFNLSQEKGFIFSIPSSHKGIHLSIGFDKKRKEFNIHFTNDNVKKRNEKRHHFILVMSSFRFFLLMKRLEILYDLLQLQMIQKSEINLGKLKRHKIMFSFLPETDVENNLLKINKKGNYIKLKRDLNVNIFAEGLRPIKEIRSCPDHTFLAYKWIGEHLSFQGFLYKSIYSDKLFFIPKKRINRFLKQFSIGIYNYLNHYPSSVNLEFRKILYKNLTTH